MKNLLLLIAFILAFPIMGNAEVWISNAPAQGLYGENASTVYYENDDFVSGAISSGQTGKLGWQLFNGTTSYISSPSDHPGIIRRDTTTTINTLTTLSHYTGIAQAWSSTNYRVTWIVRPIDVDTDTQIRVGSVNSFTQVSPSDGVYFEKLGPDTNWKCVSRASSTSDAPTDSGVLLVGSAWYKMRIERQPTRALFYINDVLVCNISTNLPLGGHAVTQIYNLTAVSKKLDHDYVDMYVSVTR